MIPRRCNRSHTNLSDIMAEVPEFEGKVDPTRFWNGFTSLKEFLTTKRFRRTKR